MVKDGAAMERLVQTDLVLFDKTGTLTAGIPRLVNGGDINPGYLDIAAAMGAHSRHPLSRALANSRRGPSADNSSFDTVSEFPGSGLEAVRNGITYRLGRADWAIENKPAATGDTPQTGQAVLSADGRFLAAFVFEDRLRREAAPTIAALQNQGYPVEIISGDRAGAVSRLAETVGVASYRSGVLPGDKAAYVKRLTEAGKKVLMVGDGLNDAPALVSAYVSMAPATAADVGRNAADFVFLHESLSAVTKAMAISKKAGQLIRQNFGLAIIYNMIAIPSAILGYATPLVAAIAMSSSSLIVVFNALRLRIGASRDNTIGHGEADSAETHDHEALAAGQGR